MSKLQLVPELYCTDINITKSFYTSILGFNIKYERPEEKFIYLSLDGISIMFEGVSGNSRHWLTGKLERPFGRGVNFQWDVIDVDALYKRVKKLSPNSIYLDLEIKSYRINNKTAIQKQFIVQDPDGYLFRFCSDDNS